MARRQPFGQGTQQWHIACLAYEARRLIRAVHMGGSGMHCGHTGLGGVTGGGVNTNTLTPRGGVEAGALMDGLLDPLSVAGVAPPTD